MRLQKKPDDGDSMLPTPTNTTDKALLYFK